jgi:hypothetical protein
MAKSKEKQVEETENVSSTLENLDFETHVRPLQDKIVELTEANETLRAQLSKALGLNGEEQVTEEEPTYPFHSLGFTHNKRKFSFAKPALNIGDGRGMDYIVTAEEVAEDAELQEKLVALYDAGETLFIIEKI